MSEQQERVAAVFNSIADTYENVGVDWFAPVAQVVVDRFDAQPGESVLDVGCGNGLVTLGLAQRVGEHGKVLGIDIADQMIEQGRSRADAKALTNVSWMVADATSLLLPGRPFDGITASLMLFFAPDPAEVVRAWRRLLRVDGRVVISTFGERSLTGKRLDDLFVPYLPPQLRDARTTGASGPFSSDEGVESFFRDAGFSSVETQHVNVPLRLADEDTWQRWSRSHGQSAMWQVVPEDKVADLVAAADAILQEASGGQWPLEVPNDIRVTVAHR